MGQTGVWKKTAAALCALLAAAVCAFSALPARAGQAETDAVLELLGSLQRADINPAWPPDIEANETAVQDLLDLYGACSAEDRARFTAGQNADLKAYFTALYEVQGRDAAEVDALFAQDSAEPPAPPQESSSASVPQPPSVSDSSSQAVPSPAPSSSVPREESSSAAPRPGTVVSTPGESAPPASLPDIQNPPETPDGGGWSGFFGGSATGPMLLILLAGLAAVVFVRFLVLLRRAGSPSDEEQGEALRDEELFGEAYGSAGRGGAQGAGDDEPPPRPKRRGIADQSEQPRHNRGAPKPQEPLHSREEPPPELWPEINPAGDAHVGDAHAGDAQGTASGRETAQSSQPAPTGGAQAAAPPAAGITLRGFSPQARTGRPAKMPFRQGRPDDIDAIDE